MTEPQPWYGHPAEPTLVTIGDVGVGQTLVVTPSGAAPVVAVSGAGAEAADRCRAR